MRVNTADKSGVTKELLCPAYAPNEQDPGYFTPSGGVG